MTDEIREQVGTPRHPTYYVWRSDERLVGVVSGSSAEAAANTYALREHVPFNVALRVVRVSQVASFGFRLQGPLLPGEDD